jgi:hypothetical protein
VRYTTAENWAKYFEISGEVHIDPGTIRRCMRKAEITGVTGKDRTGHLLVNAFYSESNIREACAEIFKTPQVDENGFFEQDAKKFATTSTWAKYFYETEGVD